MDWASRYKFPMLHANAVCAAPWKVICSSFTSLRYLETYPETVYNLVFVAVVNCECRRLFS